MAKAKASKEIQIQYVDVTDAEVREVIDRLTETIDSLVREFGFTIKVLDSISDILKKSPADMAHVRLVMNQFFGSPDYDDIELD